MNIEEFVNQMALNDKIMDGINLCHKTISSEYTTAAILFGILVAGIIVIVIILNWLIDVKEISMNKKDGTTETISSKAFVKTTIVFVVAVLIFSSLVVLPLICEDYDDDGVKQHYRSFQECLNDKITINGNTKEFNILYDKLKKLDK